MTHICASDLTSICSDNGLSPGRRQAIIRTNAGILLIKPLGTNFSKFLVEILIFSSKKMRLKVSSAKRRPFCLGLNEWRYHKLELRAAEYPLHFRYCITPQTHKSYYHFYDKIVWVWNLCYTCHVLWRHIFEDQHLFFLIDCPNGSRHM